MAQSRERQALVDRRLTDMIREIATLLLAFAPLDYMLLSQLDPLSLFGFVIIGASLFRWSVIRELRRMP
jgi:hypothetical protein